MPEKSVIVFDLDGTLSDPSEGVTASLNFALESLGLPPRPREALTRYIGPPLKEIFAELLNTRDDSRIAEGIAFFRRRYLARGYRENRLYPGIVDLLKRLRVSGARLYVATTKREDTANNVARFLGIAAFFEGIHGCGLDTPKVAILERILTRETPVREAAFMVGDRETDIAAGNAAGMRAIGVAWGFGAPGELEKAEAVAETPAGLLNYFARAGHVGPAAKKGDVR